MSQPEKNEISIVIRAYNEEKHIIKLLRGILTQSTRNVEIILMDSGSTDGTVAIAESFPGRVVKIDPKDFTFGYSLNQGYSIRYVPEAEIIHIHEESPVSIYHRYFRVGKAFKRNFPSEHFKRKDFFRLTPVGSGYGKSLY